MPDLRQGHTSRKPKEILLLSRLCTGGTEEADEKHKAALMTPPFCLVCGALYAPLIFCAGHGNIQATGKQE